MRTFKRRQKNTYEEIANAQAENILAHYHDIGTGFQATLIEKEDGSKVLSIAGTNFPNPNDLAENVNLAQGLVPEIQYQKMTEFFDSLTSGTDPKLTKDDVLTVTGHSLGGTLAQLCTATYADYVDHTYTYNSPGAANLTALDYQYNGWSPETHASVKARLPLLSLIKNQTSKTQTNFLHETLYHWELVSQSMMDLANFY
ncbi:lipase family protein [Desulfospira joergensenii]|uniref:lipase family protein n=1 Tax=Desulfospira joergensenii TaxID=53329 RepID=UPI0003B6E924|nr:hypothetical protein [Desulfospira joergensenii]